MNHTTQSYYHWETASLSNVAGTLVSETQALGTHLLDCTVCCDRFFRLQCLNEVAADFIAKHFFTSLSAIAFAVGLILLAL
jgi:hypothetical protein